MGFIDQFLEFIKNYPAIIAIASLLVSFLSFFLSLNAYKNFARNEFVKKQIEVVISLVSYLHEDFFNLAFTRYSGSGSSASEYNATIFELSELVVHDTDSEFFENPVCFGRTCNQILNIKKFIDNPFLPKSVADELINFYSRNHIDVNISDLNGSKVIILTSRTFEEGLFERLDPKSRIVKHSNAFALHTFENLKACSFNLEKAIVKWLTMYKVKEINLRKDFKSH